MIQAQALSFSYPGGHQMRFPEIRCSRGEHWLLLGSSGSGKTTLLQLLAGLRTPDSGEVLIGDTSIHKLSRARLDKFRGQQIGIVFQQAHFLEALHVEDNLVMAQTLAGKPVDHAKIRGLLGRLGLAHKIHARTYGLSQGEQQRVAIARALINDPAVILADEPTSALDDENTDEVIALLEEQANVANATLLVVTHDARLKSRFAKQVVL